MRWLIPTALCVTVILTVSACGGSASNASMTKVVRLKSPTPISFVEIRGPAGAVDYLARRLETGAFREDQVGVFVPPPRHPRPRCSFTHTIGPRDTPDLQPWRGRKVLIAVYDSAWPLCQTLQLAFYGAPPF
jgi:hypothetical protein